MRVARTFRGLRKQRRYHTGVSHDASGNADADPDPDPNPNANSVTTPAMTFHRRAFWFAAVVAALASGCAKPDGGELSCLDAAGAPSLVYPMAGSSGVDPLVGVVILKGALGVASVHLTTAEGGSVAAGSLGPPPWPLPAGVPTPPSSLNPSTFYYRAASIPQLKSQTTYSVTTFQTDPDCGTNPPSFNLGNFKTR